MGNGDSGVVLLIAIVLFGIVALAVWGANVSNSSCIIRSDGPASASITGRYRMQDYSNYYATFRNMTVDFPTASVTLPGMTIETRGETCTQALASLGRQAMLARQLR